MEQPKLPSYAGKPNSEARDAKEEIDARDIVDLIEDLYDDMEDHLDLGLHWEDKYKFWRVYAVAKALRYKQLHGHFKPISLCPECGDILAQYATSSMGSKFFTCPKCKVIYNG